MRATVLRRVAAGAALAVVLLGAPLAPASATALPASDGPSVTAENQPNAHMPMPTSPIAYEFGETLARLEGRQLETTFLAGIIPHHRAAIVMAQLELERGKSEHIRAHAENLIANQQHQIDQFTRWLEEWYELTPEQALAEAPQEAQKELAEMEQESQQMIEELRDIPAGPEFDAAFVERMIPHHQGGIIEFLEPQTRAPHVQLRVAATQGITAQEAEIIDFRTWLSEQQR